MEISKREARQHLRSVLGVLNKQSQTLKEKLRTRHGADAPRMQSDLSFTQKQLTTIHAMLAISRRRYHPFKGGPRYPKEAITEQVLKWQVARISSRGEAYLGRSWYQAQAADQLPALNVVWNALITIEDPAARAAAVRIGGPEAALIV